MVSLARDLQSCHLNVISNANPEEMEKLYFLIRFKNDSDACDVLLCAADRKDPLAAAYIGRLYQMGCQLLRKDQDKAVAYANIAMPWLQSEADKGNQYALFHLGDCYLDGRGVERDEERAARYFELAANQGHSSARTILGTTLFTIGFS